MLIECNEIGFNAQDVRAISSIGKSTKKKISGYIGSSSGSYDVCGF